MKVTMLLADAAQAVEGKLYILGGGWSIIGPEPTPMAFAIKIEVPWTEANIRHQLRVALYDEDGQPVIIPTSAGERGWLLNTGTAHATNIGNSFICYCRFAYRPPLTFSAESSVAY